MAWPIRPMPRMPSVAPWTSAPANMSTLHFVHSPRRRKCSLSADAPRRRHQQREAEVGGGLGQHVGRVGDEHAARGAGRRRRCCCSRPPCCTPRAARGRRRAASASIALRAGDEDAVLALQAARSARRGSRRRRRRWPRPRSASRRRATMSGKMRRQTRIDGLHGAVAQSRKRAKLATGSRSVTSVFSIASGSATAERHAADELLVRRARRSPRHDEAVERRERRLRAGVEAAAARRDHDALQEHAEVEPAALAHDPVDREHQADRRAEELVVAPVLRVHARLVGLGDAEQAVQVPADLAAALDEGRAPLGRVVGVLLGVASRARPGRRRRRRDASESASQRCAGEDVDVPRLRVRARRRARRRRRGSPRSSRAAPASAGRRGSSGAR